MKQIIDFEYLNNFISNVLNDIDSSLEIKTMEYRLDLETLTNKKAVLKYIKKEKKKLRDLLKKIPNKNTREIDEYRIYLKQKPLNPALRRKAIKEYFFIKYFEPIDHLFIGLFLIKSYEELRKEDFVKTTIEIATLLEFNSFLTDEINKIKQEESKEENSKQEESKQLAPNNKLTWHGSKTELVELIKSLIETGSIEGTQKDIIRNFLVFLKADIKHPNATLQRLTNRSDKVKFLDKLTSTLQEFYTKSEVNSFLSDVIDEIEQKDFNQLDSDNNKLNWLGTPTELIELCIALFVNKSIQGTQKDIIRNFLIFLNVDLENPKATLQYLADHSEKTIFLDKLKSSLIDYYIKNEEKNNKKNNSILTS